MSTSIATQRKHKRLLVTITKPGKARLVEEILREIEGVEVEQAPNTGKATTAPRKKPLSAKEKQFVHELAEAMAEVKDHLAGKKKLPLAKDLLHEL